MCTFFNSLDKQFKTPTGPLPKGEILTLRIRLPKELNPENAQFVIYEYCNSCNLCTFSMEKEKNIFEEDTYIYFKIEISNLDVNIYFYYFSFVSNGNRKFLKIRNEPWGAYICDDPISKDWQLTVYEPMNIHPNMKNGIMYQIFPDRFYKGDNLTTLPSDRVYREWGELPYYSDKKICSDFFGGNLNGITEKLDYLKSLNVSVLYLNPIWVSQSNHRYDTGSYEHVDPVLGDINSLKELIREAHSRGMIVILDLVLNHTGSDSIYFNKNGRYPNIGAYQSTDSTYYDWYYFYGTDNKIYESWWGFETLPKVNQNSNSLIEYFFGIGGIMDKYFSWGVDGFRLDVADELKNSTLERINAVSVRNRDKIVIIGEVWDNASNKCNYGHRMNYFLGHELTSVMNYPVKNSLLAYIRYGGYWAHNLKITLLSIFVEDYPREIAHSLMNFLSSHDTVRAITKLAGEEVDNHDKDWQFEHDTLSRKQYLLGRYRLMLSFLIIYLFPGIPSIFYGDEIGLSGQKDPFCRKCFTWNYIDKKLLHLLKKLGKLRKSISTFLASANFDICEIDDSKFIFLRYSNDKIVFVFTNRSDSVISLDIKDYISNYFIKYNYKLTSIQINDSTKNFNSDFWIYNPLFFLGKNSDLTTIEAYGAVVVEFIYT